MVDLKIILNTFILNTNTYSFLGKAVILDVSKNNGTPKSSICSQGFPLFSPSILGTPIFGNIHILKQDFFQLKSRSFSTTWKSIVFWPHLCGSPRKNKKHGSRNEDMKGSTTLIP